MHHYSLPFISYYSFFFFVFNGFFSPLELEQRSPSDEGGINPGNEIVIFVENAKGKRREYSVWVDKEQSMHLRVREDKNIVLDNVVVIFNKDILKIEGNYLARYYSTFPIQFFLEIDNNNLDIIYLKEGPLQLPVGIKNLDPNTMKSSAVLPSLGTITKVGLIGYGGNIQTVIWPLAFFGE